MLNPANYLMLFISVSNSNTTLVNVKFSSKEAANLARLDSNTTLVNVKFYFI